MANITAPNNIDGGAGNDTAWGGQGDDLINGGAGDDLISGDMGTNQAIGGAGIDTFLFRGSIAGNITSILDYQVGVDIVGLAGIASTDVGLSMVGNDTVMTQLSTNLTLGVVVNFNFNIQQLTFAQVDVGLT